MLSENKQQTSRQNNLGINISVWSWEICERIWLCGGYTNFNAEPVFLQNTYIISLISEINFVIVDVLCYFFLR